MADVVYPLPPDKRPPSAGTVNAFGSTFLHNSSPDADGGFFVTKWLVLLLPIVPIGRYYVQEGAVTDHSDLFTTRTTTTYYVLGRSRLRLIEIIRAYLYFWVLLPASLVGPIAASIIWFEQPDSEVPHIIGMLIGVALLLLSLGALGLYRTRWRPAREARWSQSLR